jgi:hypothetical protein
MGSSANVELTQDAKYEAFLALKESYEQDKLDLLKVVSGVLLPPSLYNLTTFVQISRVKRDA